MLTEDFNLYSFNTSEEGVVQSQSKIIKKTPKKSQRDTIFHEEETFTHTSDESSLGSSRIYDTFSSQEKVEILEEVKEEALNHVDLNDEDNWHEEVSGLKPKVYKGILAKVIPKFRPNFDYSDTKQVTQMWRKVKRMLESNKKPERRGDPNLLDNELPEFKTRLIPIILSLPTRSFQLLRERVLPVINEIRVRNGRGLVHNVFGKHKWSNYVNAPENRDILDLWNSLKRSRVSTVNEQSSTFMESTEDHDDEFEMVQPQSENDSYGLFSSEEMTMYQDLARERGFNSYSKVFNFMENEDQYQQNNNCFGGFDHGEMTFLENCSMRF